MSFVTSSEKLIHTVNQQHPNHDRCSCFACGNRGHMSESGSLRGLNARFGCLLGGGLVGCTFKWVFEQTVARN